MTDLKKRSDESSEKDPTTILVLRWDVKSRKARRKTFLDLTLTDDRPALKDIVPFYLNFDDICGKSGWGGENGNMRERLYVNLHAHIALMINHYTCKYNIPGTIYPSLKILLNGD